MYIVFSPSRSSAAFFLSRAFQRVASFAFFLFSLLSLHRMYVPVRTKTAVLATFIFNVLTGTVT